jgi:hypothetical protein
MTDDLRRWIRLCESVQMPLYHGSKRRFRNGFILLPRPKGYVSWPEVRVHEMFMERHRPPDCLPRSQCVFMVDDPQMTEMSGGYEDYVYEVQPQGKVERNDLEWYEVLNVLDFRSVRDWKKIDLNNEWIEAAKNYWNGVPHPGKSMWEYRSSSAVVVRMISE